MTTYVVEKPFDFTNEKGVIWHIDKGTFLQYEVLTNDNYLGLNNTLKINVLSADGGVTVIGPRLILIEDYIRELDVSDIHCSILNCSGRENGIKLRNVETQLKRAKKLLKDCYECFANCGISGAEGVYEIEVAINEFLKEDENENN